MAKIVVEEQKDFALLPVDSILHLKVDELEVKEVDGRNGKWEKLEITFKVLGIQAIGDGTPIADYEEQIIGSKIWGSVPFRLTDSAENKLRIWSEAILGVEMGVGFELDTDLFVGREVRGLTSQYEKRDRDAKGNPIKRHQINSLLPKANNPVVGQGVQPQQQYAQPDPWASVQQQAPANDPWGQPQQAAQPQYVQPQQQMQYDEEPPF